MIPITVALYCAQCHQAAPHLFPVTDDCACLVCEQCGLDNLENYRCGVCGADLTALYDE